jgi:hypothetical protein
MLITLVEYILGRPCCPISSVIDGLEGVPLFGFPDWGEAKLK